VKNVLTILVVIFALFCNLQTSAQSGGKKREHKNQRKSSSRLFGGRKTKGNANAFANGSRSSSSKGMFRKKHSAWTYHSTKSNTKKRNENKFLFKRNRTRGRKYNEGILARQNADRAKKRSRGNAVFHKRKYGG